MNGPVTYIDGTHRLREAEFRDRVDELAELLLDQPPERAASRKVIELLGERGLIAARWTRPDDSLGVAWVEGLASRGLLASVVAASLHVESVVAMLRHFAGPTLAPTLRSCLAGRTVGCVAASEPGGGSDLQRVCTTAVGAANEWHISGEKKFVTLGSQADFAVVLARVPASDGLAAFLVPRDGYQVVKTHRLVAGSPLETSWIAIDCTVPGDHLLGRPGLGSTVLGWGLTKERLAVAALVVGACRLALSLAVTHATHRMQFGRPLFEHQALRLRLAALQSELHTIASDLRYLSGTSTDPRRIAGLKVTAARFGERCLSECMHIFGGDGYCDDASPLGRMWRDIRLARLGGGSDEMMWEIVAGGLTADIPTYRRHVPGIASGADGANQED
jgi:alkylation response protein AidB-like acyl-CoA dehydrogenase